MGDYAKSISERDKHTRITTGHCLICGKHGSLSIDHVPPQGSVTITKVEQVHLTEMLDLKNSNVRGIKSTNGSKFKTICKKCNSSAVGQNNDREVADVCKALTRKINHFFRNANSPISGVSTPFDAVKYCRAMIGHIISATSVTECAKPSQPSPYFDPLKQFVLGDDQAIADTHDIYYWFYPHRHHLSIKLFGLKNQGHHASLSILAFFPLAFLVTEKNRGIYPAGAVKLNLSDESIFLSLSSANMHYSNFPAVPLTGDQMLLFSDSMAVVSYPIQG